MDLANKRIAQLEKELKLLHLQNSKLIKELADKNKQNMAMMDEENIEIIKTVKDTSQTVDINGDLLKFLYCQALLIDETVGMDDELPENNTIQQDDTQLMNIIHQTQSNSPKLNPNNGFEEEEKEEEEEEDDEEDVTGQEEEEGDGYQPEHNGSSNGLTFVNKSFGIPNRVYAPINNVVQENMQVREDGLEPIGEMTEDVTHSEKLEDVSNRSPSGKGLTKINVLSVSKSFGFNKYTNGNPETIKSGLVEKKDNSKATSKNLSHGNWSYLGAKKPDEYSVSQDFQVMMTPDTLASKQPINSLQLTPDMTQKCFDNQQKVNRSDEIMNHQNLNHQPNFVNVLNEKQRYSDVGRRPKVNYVKANAVKSKDPIVVKRQTKNYVSGNRDTKVMNARENNAIEVYEEYFSDEEGRYIVKGDLVHKIDEQGNILVTKMIQSSHEFDNHEIANERYPEQYVDNLDVVISEKYKGYSSSHPTESYATEHHQTGVREQPIEQVNEQEYNENSQYSNYYNYDRDCTDQSHDLVYDQTQDGEVYVKKRVSKQNNVNYVSNERNSNVFENSRKRIMDLVQNSNSRYESEQRESRQLQMQKDLRNEEYTVQNYERQDSRYTVDNRIFYSGDQSSSGAIIDHAPIKQFQTLRSSFEVEYSGQEPTYY